MRLAIRKHAQKSRSNSKQVVQKQDQSTNKIPKQVKNIYKPKLEQSVEQQGVKNRKGRVYMAKIKQGLEDFKG